MQKLTHEQLTAAKTQIGFKALGWLFLTALGTIFAVITIKGQDAWFTSIGAFSWGFCFAQAWRFVTQLGLIEKELKANSAEHDPP